MKKDNNQIKKEILEEEYMLGKEYYDKILESAKEEKLNKYK